MTDLYQAVTDRIVAALEAGAPPWIRPWQDSGLDPFARNLTTGRRYRGINVLLLNVEADLRGFWDARWLTFRQAAMLGGHIRKGERGTPIAFWKLHEVTQEDTADPDERKVIPFLRYYVVFNVAQVEGLAMKHLQPPRDPAWQPVDEAEHLLAASSAEIRHGGDRAFYSPAADVIQLPNAGQFESADAYYGTALHELTHWTGHPSRCNRPLGARQGIDAYAFEELVAEMGAAFLCAHCRLQARLEHASYISSWLSALRSDKRLIFVASAKAQAAADWVLSAAKVAPSPEALAEAA